MSEREKLSDLLYEASRKADSESYIFDQIADYLIDHGVTVQEWISVKDRLPESNKIVLASAVSKTFGYRHTLMVAHIGHHEATTEDDGWRECEVDTEYDEEKDCFWIPECWWEVNSVEDNGNWIIDSDYEVTHWMPLPQPPKGE